MTESDTKYFIKEDVTIGDTTEEYTHYYDKCPPDQSFHDQNGFECKEDCGGLPYIPGTSENICVESCTGTKFPYTDADLCVKECPKDARFYLESDKICAKKC